MKIGFIGLGNLGSTMAKRLISEGITLVVWNRTIEKAKSLKCETAKTPSELVSNTDIVFLNLFDSDAVESVMTEKHGIIHGECAGKIVIDTTTNHFERVLYFYSLLEERQAVYLEAPVLGSVIPASQGLLTILVSGDQRALEKARPYMEKIGRNIFYLGSPGLATKMKLINNLVLASFMLTLAEAIALGEKVGIQKEEVINILLSGAGNSMVLNAKREKLLKEDFSPHFSSALIYKDLHYLQDLARSLNTPLFSASVVKELFGMGLAQGLSNQDFSVVYKIFKDL